MYRSVLLLVALTACGSGGDGPRDAASDAGVDGPSIDAPPDAYVFTPDPVTVGEQLPAVVPVIKVNVSGQTIQKDVKIPGTIAVYEDHDGTLADLATKTPTLTSAILFQGRGNFTWTLPKKGYAFQFEDASNNSVELPLLGMPAGKDWALYACYTDKTCLRDALVYAFGQRLGRWSPRTRFVELFIDDQYQGIYMVWERIRRQATRVSIAKPADSVSTGNITGGYIIRHEGGGNGGGEDFSVTQGTVYTFDYPSVTKLTTEQDFVHTHERTNVVRMIAKPSISRRGSERDRRWFAHHAQKSKFLVTDSTRVINLIITFSITTETWRERRSVESYDSCEGWSLTTEVTELPAAKTAPRKWRPACECGTQSHGTLRVSRAT